MDVSIPKAMRKQASSELASGFISGRKVHVRVHVPHDPFLLDYMLGLTEEFGLRIRETYGTAHTSKELTKAGAALYYATNFDAGGGRVGCYVIGKEKGPTISFLLAKLTDWDVVSIDPACAGGSGQRDGVTYIADFDYNVDVMADAGTFGARRRHRGPRAQRHGCFLRAHRSRKAVARRDPLLQKDLHSRPDVRLSVSGCHRAPATGS